MLYLGAVLIPFYCNADMAEKIGPSIFCQKYDISFKPIVLSVLIQLILTASYCFTHVPFFLQDKGAILITVSFLTICVLSLFSWMGFYMLTYICVHNLKNDCRALLLEDIVELEHLQEILNHYGKIKQGFSLAAFFVFSTLAVCLTLTLYIGVSGRHV